MVQCVGGNTAQKTNLCMGILITEDGRELQETRDWNSVNLTAIRLNKYYFSKGMSISNNTSSWHCRHNVSKCQVS